MVKEKKVKEIHKFSILRIFFYSGFILSVLLLTFLVSFYIQYEKMYKGKIYPGVTVDNRQFGGKTSVDVENYFNEKNKAFEDIDLTLFYEDKIATISADELKAGFDGKLSAIQAHLIGRSGNILSDFYQKFRAKTTGVNLQSVLTMNGDYIDENIIYLSEIIDLPAEDALFNFEEGRVKLFKLSKNGLKLNKEKTREEILNFFDPVAKNGSVKTESRLIALPVEKLQSEISTEKANNFGIKELIGEGKSKFSGSIAGRIHNIELAASRLNGRLIAPGSEVSFNNALGDVSAATGFQPAYVIKDGRTVLGDGGGVCQGSTTLFRAALNSGLPISERHAHSYRVSYYEQDSPPGLDATVFAPSVDLKFKNDTPGHILIQVKVDKSVPSLTFSLYGTSDGRIAEISKPVILSSVPPPPDLYQDDPTLPAGTVKQVDWKAWGAKVNFNYKVTRDGIELFKNAFFSNFQPWQAVFLRGTKV